MTRMYDRLKRVIDLGAASVGLVVLAPVMAGVAVTVRAKLGRPVVFKQPRPGHNGGNFTILKFRTMLEIDEARGRVTNEQRTHPFGQFLRSTSLDELPSLWNVVRGDLSLVGPRPLRMSYLGRYSDAQARRHEIRPGLTGLAQVSGRNDLTWDQRLELDQRYVDQRGPVLDLRILMATVAKTVRREGISAEGQATMSEFFGPRQTERLHLVDLAPEHLQTRVDWLRSPEVSEGVSLSFEPELEPTKRWFERAVADTTRSDWVALDRAGVLRAMCGLTDIAEERCELYVYVDPRSLGKGYGRETMQLLMARARELGVATLNLQTKRENERSRRLYYSLGFETRADPSLDSAMVAMSISLRSTTN